MSERTVQNPSRRGFLGRTVTLAGTMPFAPSLLFLAPGLAGGAGEPAAKLTSRYRSLNADEAAFTEKLVNTRCPADDLTSDGVSSGLATFIDRHLAGDFDDGANRSARVGQKQLFKAGIAAADDACRERFGLSFHQLAPSDARDFLRDISTGCIPAEFPLASWARETVDPLLTQACFSGPVYDAYGTKMFWKLFGYVTGPVSSSKL